MQVYEEHGWKKDREAPFCVFSEDEDREYVHQILSEEPPLRWWAEQVLYEERQRAGRPDKLERVIKAKLDTQGATPELGLRF